MSLTTTRIGYKPFKYDWAYASWKTQQSIHWLPDEVPLADDVKDWSGKLTKEEKNLLTQIFRFFTQADIEVNDCYMNRYAQIFKPTEIKMMLAAFSNMETIHIDAYSHLLETVGMPEVEYSSFMKYKAMKDKCDYLQAVTNDNPMDIAVALATFGAFTEGLSLFASFAMLLNFPRHNKMKGMGQIITWSVRDETLHCESIIKLFNTYVSENKLDREELGIRIVAVAEAIVAQEDAFIDLAFELGAVEGMTADDIKKYIRYIADRRLLQLKFRTHFKVKKNPLLWMEEMLNGKEHGNFFETRVTEYSKSATTGTWEEAFDVLHD
jgi:ribonucleoside-diphosphate reductase beta chain